MVGRVCQGAALMVLTVTEVLGLIAAALWVVPVGLLLMCLLQRWFVHPYLHPKRFPVV